MKQSIIQFFKDYWYPLVCLILVHVWIIGTIIQEIQSSDWAALQQSFIAYPLGFLIGYSVMKTVDRV